MIFLKAERIRAKFLVKLGKKGTELVDMLKEPYEENARSNHLQMDEVVSSRKRKDVKNDDACEARPSTLPPMRTSNMFVNLSYQIGELLAG